jgi:hypothetical protein
VNPLVAAMVRDLEAASPQLLEIGVDESRNSRTTEGPLGSLVRTFSKLLPRLLADLRHHPASTLVTTAPSYVPTREPLSRRATDYRIRDGRMLPLRWVRVESVPTADLQALRWLLYLCDELEKRVTERRSRVEKQFNEALRTRGGRSEHGKAVETALQDMRGALQTTSQTLERARRRIMRTSEQQIGASARTPDPVPPGEAWAAIRRLHSTRLTEEALLAAQVSEVLSGANAADIPFLYQRWCGLKLVEGLQSLGWHPEQDVSGPLWLGGRIPFRHGHGHQLMVWVEPRLERARVHPSGFRCARGDEVSPDYLIVTPGPGGRDAFLLDPTLSTDRAALNEKGKYLTRIELGIFATLAGCPVVRRPRLSWALSPLNGRHGHLLTSDGRVGAIPMNPDGFIIAPLRAWLTDVTRHAKAWSLVDRPTSTYRDSDVVARPKV